MQKTQLYEVWSLYQSTVFQWKSTPLARQPFAIVTAFNPNGEQFTQIANDQLNAELHTILEREKFQFSAIDGSSKDFSHVEASFAINCPKSDALRIAEQFQQNAIYWVEHEELILVPCLLMQFSDVNLGNFGERLVTN